MKSFAAIAAFAVGTNALVGRSDSCCFDLTASGDASGTLGQLTDGQVRLGDNSLSAAKFCIDSAGGITDSEGRGCVVTTETTQFQCDTGATATTGFSVSSSGELEYNGSPYFIACETGQNGGRNIYTTNSTSVTQCKNIELTADSCSGSGAGSGSGSGSSASASASASSPPQSSSLPHSTAPAVPSNSAAPSGGSSPSGGGSSGGSSPSGGGSGSPSPSGAESIVPSAPAPSASSPPLSGSPIYVTSTVTVTDCHCPTAPAGGGAPVPTSPAAGGGGGVVGGGGSGPSGSSAPSGPVPESPAPHSTPAPGGGGGGVAPSGSPVPHSSAPHGSPAPSGTPAPGGGSQSSAGPRPSGGGGSSPSAPAVSSTPAQSIHATTSIVVPPASSSAAKPSTSATGSSTAAGSCATTLIEAPSQYQYPHLIVPVNSTTPNTAYGTQYFGTVSSTVSTIFNFDIPTSWQGSTCNLVFLFPQKADLETSDYTFSGDGKLDFTKLSEVATTDTTYASTPSVAENLGDITISAGNSYVVSTFSCPAGEAVAYEISEGGTTDLYWFNDWNPSPLGIFITKC